MVFIIDIREFNTEDTNNINLKALNELLERFNLVARGFEIANYNKASDLAMDLVDTFEELDYELKIVPA